MSAEAVGKSRIAVAQTSAQPAPVRDEISVAPQLVARARLGSTSAFEQLVREFGPRVYRFLVLRLANESDARDALQETLIAAWQRLPTLRELDRFWPWLVGIAAHKAADVVRKRRPSALERADDRTAPGPAAVVELREAIAGLPPALRDVVLLRYLLHLSEQETAAALGVRVGTVKSRAARARRRIGEVIGEDG